MYNSHTLRHNARLVQSVNNNNCIIVFCIIYFNKISQFHPSCSARSVSVCEKLALLWRSSAIFNMKDDLFDPNDVVQSSSNRMTRKWNNNKIP